MIYKICVRNFFPFTCRHFIVAQTFHKCIPRRIILFVPITFNKKIGAITFYSVLISTLSNCFGLFSTLPLYTPSELLLLSGSTEAERGGWRRKGGKKSYRVRSFGLISPEFVVTVVRSVTVNHLRRWRDFRVPACLDNDAVQVPRVYDIYSAV